MNDTSKSAADAATPESPAPAGPPVRIDVAGDVCLDLVGNPEPPQLASKNNWQLTGETRTHYLLGGAMLLAQFVRDAVPGAEVRGIRPLLVDGVKYKRKRPGSELTDKEFLEIAERLTREDIVRSFLAIDCFPAKPDDKKKEQLRVKEKCGYSGPREVEPKLALSPPDNRAGPPDIVVLDDSGNRFRHTPSQWPSALLQNDAKPLIVYKLHRELPGEGDAATDPGKSPLWQKLTDDFADQRITVISIDDLRAMDAPISYGLSWERTALDLVWQLLNVERFKPLRDCKHLIVRFGLDGAVYWSRRHATVKERNVERDEMGYRAWLIYDPQGIEGTGEKSCAGTMVGYGSAFTAALVKHLAAVTAADRAALGNTSGEIDGCIKEGIQAGLLASRRLLRAGFGNKSASQPQYPTEEPFQKADKKKDDYFSCQPIPILKHALVPDRGYWRLLDSIFAKKTALLNRAVDLTAASVKPTDKSDPRDIEAHELLRQVPMAVYEGLRTYDRREIENYRALYSLIHDYARQNSAARPLNVAVFGPPGAGKSFGVKQVAKALAKLSGSRPIQDLTFNLSQYHSADQLADVFHLVRDVVLRGNVPLVFFDEFDTALGGTALGWLRYLLAPMQDAEFLDGGQPHPIGQAIFVFAGGTSTAYAEFARPFLDPACEPELRHAFKAAKGPDFLSRLRGTLDVPGLDLHQPFDAYGPIESLPCEPAILLRRAGILAFQLKQKSPTLCDANGAVQISPQVLRALLHLPKFVHGNRSFEAVLDMSRIFQATKFTPASLPGPSHLQLHAEAEYVNQLLGTAYPFPDDERELIAQAIHRGYLDKKKSESPATDPRSVPELAEWKDLRADLQESNRQQADDIARKLRSVGLWFRKKLPAPPGAMNRATIDPEHLLRPHVETLAKMEHDRWVAEKRRSGWVAAPGKERKYHSDTLLLHNCIFPWEELDERTKDYDREPVLDIPTYLDAADYEIVRL